MSHPFKGIESSKWVHLGKTRSYAGQLLFVTLRVQRVGRWGGALFFVFVGSWATGTQSVALHTIQLS
jgi:hypothetical protein